MIGAGEERSIRFTAKAAKIEWAPDRLDSFLTRPAILIRGPRRAFAGHPNAQEEGI
jgi:cytochrome c2